jgi:OmpA-OmpF porin, OOP family
MRILHAFVVACALSIPSLPQAFAANLEDHPAITAYPDSVATQRDDDGFRSYNLVVGVDAKGKTDTDFLKTLTVEGNVTRLAYDNPKNRSADEIFANYREALAKAGFEILFACADTQCGPSYATSRWSRVTGLRYFSPGMLYLAAKSAKDGEDIYVAILAAKSRHQIEIVEVTAMETGLVTAKAIADGLLLDGRVVLDGILFDTDKAVLKQQSKEALDVIAGFLAANPDLSVYIVGHTDGTGGFDHNQTLSKNRAEAVVTALVKTYGIDAARLASHGVGPLSPQKANQNEAGRSQNRRVEMVQR